ncbi:MAG: YfiR family protein, partial [Desulfobacteraceae bacterium]
QKTCQKWSGLRHQFLRHSILTVSDMTRFGQMGGMVNIQTQDNKLKIEINPYETRKAGLIVSSKLLKVARQVKSDDQETHQ